jgi:hypothetical protein
LRSWIPPEVCQQHPLADRAANPENPAFFADPLSIQETGVNNLIKLQSCNSNPLAKQKTNNDNSTVIKPHFFEKKFSVQETFWALDPLLKQTFQEWI